VPSLTLAATDFESRAALERAIVGALKEAQIDWLLLAGYMRRCGDTLLRAFPSRILNIHPSLLPAYKGLHAIKRAYDDGASETGCTVHLVDRGLDTGPALASAALPLRDGEPLEELSERVHQAEHLLFPYVLSQIAAGNLREGISRPFICSLESASSATSSEVAIPSSPGASSLSTSSADFAALGIELRLPPPLLPSSHRPRTRTKGQSA